MPDSPKGRRNAVTQLYRSASQTTVGSASSGSIPEYDLTDENERLVQFIETHGCYTGANAWILSGLTSGFVSSMTFMSKLGMPYGKDEKRKTRVFEPFTDTAIFLRSGNPKVQDEPQDPKSGLNICLKVLDMA